MGRYEQVTLAYVISFEFNQTDETKQRFIDEGMVRFDAEKHLYIQQTPVPNSDDILINESYSMYLFNLSKEVRARFIGFDLITHPIGGEIDTYMTDDVDTTVIYVYIPQKCINTSCKGYMGPLEIPDTIMDYFNEVFMWNDEEKAMIPEMIKFMSERGFTQRIIEPNLDPTLEQIRSL